MDEEFLSSTALPEYTPDLFLLEQAERQLVFECGPLRYDAPYLSTAYTVEKMTLMKQHDRVAVPFRASGFPRARVQGTLYLMTAEQIVALDKKRQNGVIFDRKPTFVVTPILDQYGEPARLPRPAWMYKARIEYWEPEIEWDLQANRCGHMRAQHQFDLAEQYPNHEHRFFHNHYSFNGIPVEASDGMPEIKITQASAEIIKKIGAMNEIQARQLRRNKGLFFPAKRSRNSPRIDEVMALRSFKDQAHRELHILAMRELRAQILNVK